MCGLAAVSLGASLIGGAASAYGAIQSAQAQSAAASYQAEVSRRNQIIADQSATYARQAGAAQEATQRMKTAALIGAIRSGQASNGFDINSGSNLDVQIGASSIGELDALTIRQNADLTARGYKQQGVNFGAQAGMYDATASNAGTAGTVGALGSLVGTASSVSDKWMTYKRQGVSIF